MKKTLFFIVALGMAVSDLAAQPSAIDTLPKKAYLVGNAHFDSQWRWTVQRSLNEFLPNTIYQNFKLFEDYPDYILNFEGGIKYQWIREYFPREYETMKQYIAEGRWHVSGSSWDANDTNVPSVESAIRNILLAQTFYKDEFGVKSTDIMLPDCFGFSYTLPSVAAHCGLTGFHTQKLSWRHKPFYEDGKKVPFEFGLWQGVDDSRIFAAMDGGGYGWNPREDITESPELTDRVSASAVNAAFRYFGTRSSELRGDRGGSALPRTLRNIMRGISKGGEMDIRMTASDAIFKDFAYLKDSGLLPVHDGELLMDVHGTGCYSSQADMKKLNRRNEQLGYAAEAANVISDWTGDLPYQYYTINDAWKRFIWHQFHDDLTGTSIPEAYTFSWNDEVIAQNQFAAVLESAVAAVSSRMKTDAVKGIPVVVFNPAATRNRDMVKIRIPMPEGNAGVKVYSPEGRLVKSQLLDLKDGIATVVFASDTPPVSLSVYDVRPAGKDSRRSSFTVSGNSIENDIYRLVLNADGDIASIVDKRCGKELVAEGSYFGLAVFEENTSDRWPAWEILKKVVDKESVPVADSVSVSVEVDGPLMAVLRVERKYGDSKFIQRIIMTDGAVDDRIDVETLADWNSPRTLLKTQFPMAFSAEKATYDLGLGTVSRGNNTDIQYEVPAYQWADLTASDGSYGVTVMNDSKYGWDKPSDNTIRLTLLHTPTADFDWFPHQKNQDLGKHRFTYSIAGHTGTLKPEDASSAADVLNHRKMAFVVGKHDGELGKTFSMVSSSSDNVVIKCLKKAEDGDGYIVRVYETAGRDSDAVLSFPAEILSAEEVNGIEETVGKAEFSGRELPVNIGHYSLRTYRVRLAQSALSAPEQRKFTHVRLPYNSMSITSDAFCAVGNMDGKWNSYAAELIPDTLVYKGVPFVFGEADYANAVRCDGQKVSVPDGTAGVYVLMASSDGDREVKFGQDADCGTVPYYSGFFGQCRYAGYYDSPYLKDGDIAYVGTHRHNPYQRNEPYVFTYMFMSYVPVADGAGEIVLPEDDGITVFAATAVNSPLPTADPVSEIVTEIL